MDKQAALKTYLASAASSIPAWRIELWRAAEAKKMQTKAQGASK